MANNYIKFSECVAFDLVEEKQWFEQQLKKIRVYGERVYYDGDPIPGIDEEDQEFWGPLFLRDYEGREEDGYLTEIGFSYELEDDHIQIFAEEGEGDPDKAAYIGQKYLHHFHPTDTWTLTFAEVCDQPRTGEFGGGAILVTAEKCVGFNAHREIANIKERFEKLGHNDNLWGEDNEYPRADWAMEVGQNDTSLGYWDWILHKLISAEEATLSRDCPEELLDCPDVDQVLAAMSENDLRNCLRRMVVAIRADWDLADMKQVAKHWGFIP